MKYIKVNFKNISLILLVTILVMGISSCKKDNFDVNVNPNNPTDSTITYVTILPAALDASGRIVASQWGWLQNWMSYWARNASNYAANQEEETYTVTSNFQTGIWSSLYDNLYDYDIMQRKAHTANAYFYEGMARIMKAHDFQMLVDVYNDVPYTNAFKGLNNLTPKYDKGIDVYKDLLRQLDTAIVLIKKSNPSGYDNPDKSLTKTSSNPDIMFNGSKTLWIKFANTLKLRLLVHMSGVSGIDFATEFATINTEGTGFLGTTQNAAVNPGYRADKPNPFWSTYMYKINGITPTGNNVYYRGNRWGVIYYLVNDDPRVSKFYQNVTSGIGNPVLDPTVYGNFGLYSGCNYGGAGSSTPSPIGSGLGQSPSQSQWILTSTESLFLQTEAMELGWLTGDVVTTYNDAVQESFAWLWNYNVAPDANGSAYTDYFSGYQSNISGNPDIDITATTDTISTIMNGKWFALNGIAPLEIWNDYRRNDKALGENTMPFFGLSTGPAISQLTSNTHTTLPLRLYYPQSEFNYNKDNVKTVDPFADKIFWDKN